MRRRSASRKRSAGSGPSARIDTGGETSKENRKARKKQGGEKARLQESATVPPFLSFSCFRGFLID